ncbi:hypothetical protein MRX96_043529 [Rhipicephalus microplus]
MNPCAWPAKPVQQRRDPNTRQGGEGSRPLPFVGQPAPSFPLRRSPTFFGATQRERRIGRATNTTTSDAAKTRRNPLICHRRLTFRETPAAATNRPLWDGTGRDSLPLGDTVRRK